MSIRRAFADLPHGQVHYRIRPGADARPLLLLHSSPGSARQLVGLMNAMPGGRMLIAPDTPGNGDSAPHPLPEPEIGDYAETLRHFLDTIGVGQVEVMGSHTGAAIAVELAVGAPDRVGKVLIDGVGIFDDAERQAHLAHYAAPFTPDLDGAYLSRAFQFCRDQYLFYPWYERSKAARRDNGLRSPVEFHAWLVEVLKANETYPLAYRASFRWPALARLSMLAQPTLLMAAADDPLFACTRGAAPLIPDGRFEPLPRSDDAAFAHRRGAVINAFLES